MKMIELPFWRRQSWRIRKKGHPFLLVNPFNKFCTVFLIRYDQFPLRLLLQEVRCYSRKLTKATQSTSNLRRFHLFRDTLIEARRRKKPTEVELSAPPKDCRATSHILQPPILPPQRSASRTSIKFCGGMFGLILLQVIIKGTFFLDTQYGIGSLLSRHRGPTGREESHIRYLR